MEERRLGNIYGFDGGNYAGNVYDDEMLSPTIRTYQGGNQQPMIVAMRGRNPDNPSDRTTGAPTEQRLEPDSQGTITANGNISSFRKAEGDNSNHQLYKQAGNSIVKNVLMEIFRQIT